jgi:hypothetical protein
MKNKRVLTLLLSLALGFNLTGCGYKTEPYDNGYLIINKCEDFPVTDTMIEDVDSKDLTISYGENSVLMIHYEDQLGISKDEMLNAVLDSYKENSTLNSTVEFKKSKLSGYEGLSTSVEITDRNGSDAELYVNVVDVDKYGAFLMIASVDKSEKSKVKNLIQDTVKNLKISKGLKDVAK